MIVLQDSVSASRFRGASPEHFYKTGLRVGDLRGIPTKVLQSGVLVLGFQGASPQ